MVSYACVRTARQRSYAVELTVAVLSTLSTNDAVLTSSIAVTFLSPMAVISSPQAAYPVHVVTRSWTPLAGAANVQISLSGFQLSFILMLALWVRATPLKVIPVNIGSG